MRELPISPIAVLGLSPEGADALLDELERDVPVRPPLVEVPPDVAREAIVFGDTHGDWRSTEAVVDLFSEGDERRVLIGLGDYVDRSTDDCAEGSVANAMYLLSLAGRFPDRVFLLQGNHETSRTVPPLPHTLPEEIDALWGPSSERYDRLVGLLERGPIAATTTNGLYLAHAGFPRHLDPDWRATFGHLNVDALCEIVWAECDAARSRRGGAPVWGARDLDQFLSASGLGLMLRGHDPDLCGRPLYGGRCMTLHTTRIYEVYGGVIAAMVPLDRPVRSVAEMRVRHLPTEGRSFSPP
jgi:hypothetical protein